MIMDYGKVRISKKMASPISRYFFRYLLWKLTKKTKIKRQVIPTPAEIRARDLQNRNTQHCGSTILLGQTQSIECGAAAMFIQLNVSEDILDRLN
jgi:hypothetical protein